MKHLLTSATLVRAHSLELLENRIAPAFATVLDVSTLVGPNGFHFQIGAIDAGDVISTQGAGDVNNDGFEDIIVNATYVYQTNQEVSYLIYGKSGGFTAGLELLNLKSTDGFKIGDDAVGDHVTNVSAAGDINHDGFADLVVSGSGNGIATADYVFFGHDGAFPAKVALSSLTGFKIDDGGSGVVAAGDVNGDQIDDLLINPIAGLATGAQYVVFGHTSPFTGTLDLTALTGAEGFKITGGGLVFSMSKAGDVNGDGFGDIILGAPFASLNASGISYLIFGHGGPFSASLDITNLNGTNGLELLGQIEDRNAGSSVSSAGDLNDDGFDDVAVGSIEGDVYVVFGHDGVFPASLSLSGLTGPTGMVIQRGPLDDDGGVAVRAAGDFNGDGFDDLLIGDRKAEIFNNYDDRLGVTYVVYGHHGAFGDSLALSSLDGTQGVQINGEGSAAEVNAAGDVNGDGFDDLLISGPMTSYVLFGPGFHAIVPQISANGKTAKFLDGDGDGVTVKISTGTLDASNFAINAAPGGVAGGGYFGGLDLSDAEFAGAKLTITAKRGPLGGDGLINLGFLDATGVDLGKVKIKGDLGRIEAGDANLATPALLSLDLVSMGILGEFTQYDIVQDPMSNVVGSIPKITVSGDMRALQLNAESLGTVIIAGSLNQSIHLNGNLTALSVGGDIQFSNISVGGDIGHIGAGSEPGQYRLTGGITVKGSMHRGGIFTTDLSRLKVGGSISETGIIAGGDLDPVNLLAAQTVGSITVGGGFESSGVYIGENNPDVQVGRIRVGTDWIKSSVYVGAFTVSNEGIPGIIAGGDPAILASVASIVIKGHVLGNFEAFDQFDFYAEHIGAFKSGGAALPMTAGADVFSIGSTFDVTVRDLA
jgi:hypothetical protein